jgi:hypothetical protein
VGLGAQVGVDLTPRTEATAAWGLYRVQALCDVCSSGGGPGWLGSELLGSTDLLVRVAHTAPVGARGGLVLAAGAVLPASRDALSCDPMYGAPTAGAEFDLPAGGSLVRVGVDASRPIWRYDAAPVGRCAPALRGSATVDTLTGPVQPTPWAGDWFGAANPTLSGAATLSWRDPHALLHEVPHLETALTVGLPYARAPGQAAATVVTETGPVEVAAGANPVRTAVPWSVEAGWRFDDRWTVRATVADRVPTLLADPGGAFRALPATTALGVAVIAHL